MRKLGSVLWFFYVFLCLMLSALNLHEHKVPSVEEFDLSQFEKKLEEVDNAEATVVNK